MFSEHSETSVTFEKDKYAFNVLRTWLKIMQIHVNYVLLTLMEEHLFIWR